MKDHDCLKNKLFVLISISSKRFPAKSKFQNWKGGIFLEKNKLKVTSISYINDAEAANKWFEIYMDLLVEQMKKDKKVENNSYK